MGQGTKEGEMKGRKKNQKRKQWKQTKIFIVLLSTCFLLSPSNLAIKWVGGLFFTIVFTHNSWKAKCVLLCGTYKSVCTTLWETLMVAQKSMENSTLNGRGFGWYDGPCFLSTHSFLCWWKVRCNSQADGDTSQFKKKVDSVPGIVGWGCSLPHV